MHTDIHDRNTQPRAAQLATVILMLLTMLTLLVALTQSSSAQAESSAPDSTSNDRSKVTASLATDRIAFVSKRDGQTGTDIYTMDSDGNNTIRLTSGGDGEDNVMEPTWSPDRSKIAYIDAGPVCNCGYAIYVMNADGSNQHPVYTSQPTQYPAWSPDGTRIAFVTYGTYDIYVMNADGSGATPLTTGSDIDISPTWSPDGSQIAYARWNAGLYGLYAMNADGSNQHPLAIPPSEHGYSDPSWSPDGLKIAFTHQTPPVGDPMRIDGGCYSRINIMNADGSGITPVTLGQCDAEPTWSADSSKIAYVERVPSVGSQIYVIDANGSNDHNISGLSYYDYQPDWQHGLSSTVLVQDEQGTPVAGAEVYTNTLGPGSPATLIGTTDMSGTLALPHPVEDEYLIARSLIYTGTTSKAAHDNWAYHVWLTNIDQETDGSQSAYVITDTSKFTQTVVIKRSDAQIGLNVVGSFNYNATSETLASTRDGMQSASQYLFDVTDGQMFYEDFALYEDNTHYRDADIQFRPSVWPAADADGPAGMTGTSAHLYMPGPGFDGQQYWGGWEQPSSYRTFVHEFGHYAFGAFDEYEKMQAGKEVTSTCTLDPYAFDEQSRASIMNFQYDSTEICDDLNHNNDTDQGQINNESVWATFVRNWGDSLNRWTLRSPMTRNGFTDPGPYTLPGMDQMNSMITEIDPEACAGIVTNITVTLSGTTHPASGLKVFLHHGGRIIDEGPTDGYGISIVYGAIIGDSITASGVTTGTTYTGSYTVGACSDTPTIELTATHLSQPDNGELGANLPTSFTRYWLTSTLNYSQQRLDLALHFDGEVPTAPSLSVSQDGGTGAPVSLTYDPATYTYVGSFTVDPAYASQFTADVQVPSGSQTIASTYRIVGARYTTAGPAQGQNVQQVPLRTTAPIGWTLLPPESMVTISVDASSLAEDTGIASGQTDLSAPLPDGYLPVGGPFYVQGDQPITGTVGLSLNYQAEYFCGLQPGSVAIYRYDGNGWAAMPTTLNTEWNRAYADLPQWGIYGVFAKANPQAVFQDVPEGSTFYNYINWMTCHGIASGYADNTFRPQNNASRGQISKMIALTYNWHLEPPVNDYTFADVLPASTFFLYVEAAYREGVVAGYPCGGPGEPCDAQNRSYFRPSSNVTRGQISKIISNGSRFDDTVSGQAFEDVLPGSTFYDFIGRMASREIINGYPCGGPGEPCGSGNLPYFRPSSNATRGQLSKIIYLTLQPR